ncbi:MAG: hypothetical protein KAT65_23800 [Methanophagales archaeon]|nr:hypothetical protein [Methanophagales archaeon]
MTRVIQSWDIRSTSDIRSNWGYRRTGSDMNELYEIFGIDLIRFPKEREVPYGQIYSIIKSY